MEIEGREFKRDSTYVMGILNLTPDSFFDGGKWNNLDTALKRAEQMILEGADIIDVGGESSRPGSVKISVNEEIERIGDIISKIKEKFNVPISIDTVKREVAEVAVSQGASIVNCVEIDSGLLKLIAETKVHCCLLCSENVENSNYVDGLIEETEKMVNFAMKQGVLEEKIIVDPGIGFNKTVEENLQILNNLEKFKKFKTPMLLGTSNKSFIGKVLETEVDDRLEGTIATTVLAKLKGVMFVRVHDVLKNKRVIKLTEAILKSG